jgi:O-methyltransferase involved in polyketide biosynthesis
VNEFLSKHDDCIVLHLGCGLDSRVYRTKNKNADWYDVDYKEVIELRRLFYDESDRYHLIASSVTQREWIEKIPQNNGNCIVVAEGLFMYLKEEEIKTLISRLYERSGKYTLIFDAYSTLAAKKSMKHPSLQKTGAVVYWGIDNEVEMTKWHKDIKFIREEYFTSSEELNKLDSITKLIFKMAGFFKIAKKAHRILIYEIG